MKIDWFFLIMGIANIIMGIIQIVYKKDLGIAIFIIAIGTSLLFKSYYQERMSFPYLWRTGHKLLVLLLIILIILIFILLFAV